MPSNILTSYSLRKWQVPCAIMVERFVFQYLEREIGMQWHGFKIPVIVLSLLAGIAFIFGVQWLYQKYNFQEPLNAALQKNKAVESFQVVNQGRTLEVSFSVSYNESLKKTYYEVRQEISSAMGKRQFNLVLVDNRNENLERVWYNSQYAVYQAIAQGSYQEMADVVNREASVANAEAEIHVDQENIYIRLKQQGHTLDEVIPRGAGQIHGKIQASTAGGGFYAQRN